MKVMKPGFFNGDMPVSQAVEIACSEDRDDRLDQLRASHDATAALIGRLVEKLNANGLLNNKDVLDILGYGFRDADASAADEDEED